MLSRVKSLPCNSEFSYIKVYLPDSTIFLMDSLMNVVLYQKTGISGVGVSFADQSTDFDIEIDIRDGRRPSDLTKFLFSGDYRFLTQNLDTPQSYYYGVDLKLANRSNDNWFVIHTSNQSNNFTISGVSGQALLVRVCGSFDVLFDDTRTGKLVPATGEFEFDVALL
ncbi:MAG: hypothetical protein ABJ004_18195 [Cyclobacteriaceae bacterium]